jgi:hypothetical protein
MSDQRRPITHITQDFLPQDVSFDASAFDRAIRSQGITMTHFKAMRCPVGMTDIGDLRQVHEDHSGCSGGFLFVKAGPVTCLFTSNSKHNSTNDAGFYSSDSAQCSLPTHYDDSEKLVIVAPFDRFYIEPDDIVVPYWQLFTHHESGVDRFKYAISSVESLVDNNNNTYTEGEDFVVEAGKLKWIGRQPGPTIGLGPGTETDRGAVCSIRFLYRPYFRCANVGHELRLSQIQNPMTGERKLQRMPQLITLHREYVGTDSPNDDTPKADNTDYARQMFSSMNGGFGSK